MSAVGGSIIEISLKGRKFSVDGEADVSLALKNFENEFKVNGNGTSRLLRKRVPHMLEGLTLSIDDNQGDLEYLSELNDKGDDLTDGLFQVTVEMPSGQRYGGRGQIVGDIKFQSGDATAEINLNLIGMTQL